MPEVPFKGPETWEPWATAAAEERHTLCLSARRSDCSPGTGCGVVVPGDSNRNASNALVAQGAVERVTRCLVQGAAGQAHRESAATVLSACLSAGTASETTALANELCTRLIRLSETLEHLNQTAKKVGTSDETTPAIDTVCKAVVAAVGALTREQCHGETDASDSTMRLWVPESPLIARQTESPVGVEADVDTDNSLFPNASPSRGIPTITTLRQSCDEGASILSSAPLSAITEYADHRVAVAAWTTRHAQRQLQRYKEERARDDEIRAVVDTERARLEALIARCDKELVGLQKQHLEHTSSLKYLQDSSTFEQEALDMALKYERQIQTTLDREIKQMQLRLDAHRARKKSSENKVTSLQRKLDQSHESLHRAAQEQQAVLAFVEVGMRDVNMRRWVGKLGATFIDDIEGEAARLSSSSLQAKEGKLSSMVSAASAAVNDALEAQSCLVSRLACGRAQLSDLLLMSPTSSSTLTESEVAGGAVLPQPQFPPATPPGQQETSSFTSMRGDSFGNSSASHQDIAVCGNDILIVMTRAATAAEELHNRFAELVRESMTLELGLPQSIAEMSTGVYQAMADLVDGTRGDALETVFNEVSASVPQLRRPVSLDELTDDAGGPRRATLGSSVGTAKRGLPKKLARVRAGGSQVSTVDQRGPTTTMAGRPPSSMSLDHAAARASTFDSGSRQTWVSFIAQFRTVFGTPS